jgi:ribosome biogenesis GTPase
MNLEDLGYDHWFQERTTDRTTTGGQLARIVAVDRDRYVINNALKSVPAELTGRLMYSAETNDAMPCVGDWVLVNFFDADTHAIIYDLLPRKSILRRKTVGRQVDYQLIAANIDAAFIVQSCDVDYNLNRLDRYIVMTRDGGIEPILLLNKSDLIDRAHLESMIAEVEKNHNIKIVALSNISGVGYDTFNSILEKGKTYCLIGSSGVGKSTILNYLLGKEEFITNSVREKSGKGKHTTTRRQLVVLDNGVIFVDTPGMKELGMISFDLGIDESFQDIAEIAKGCLFKNCSHTDEKRCAILREVAAGKLSADRYQSYLKLMNESSHYGMSYFEKRRKDKAFGKLVKNYMKYYKKQ